MPFNINDSLSKWNLFFLQKLWTRSWFLQSRSDENGLRKILCLQYVLLILEQEIADVNPRKVTRHIAIEKKKYKVNGKNANYFYCGLKTI